MKLLENYRNASKKYGDNMAKNMMNAGIPDKYILAACRFHCEPPQKSIAELSVKFRQWMSYVVPTQNIDVNTIDYEEFSNLIDIERKKYICPNPIYNDENITIGHFLSKKDAKLCPLKPIGSRDYSFCVCNELGFNKYTKQGYQIYNVYDRSKQNSLDNNKIIFILIKDGKINLWDARNVHLSKDSAINYLKHLPRKAYMALMNEIEQTKNVKASNESKTTHKSIQILSEIQFRKIVHDGIMNALKDLGLIF